MLGERAHKSSSGDEVNEDDKNTLKQFVTPCKVICNRIVNEFLLTFELLPNAEEHFHAPTSAE